MAATPAPSDAVAELLVPDFAQLAASAIAHEDDRTALTRANAQTPLHALDRDGCSAVTGHCGRHRREAL